MSSPYTFDSGVLDKIAWYTLKIQNLIKSARTALFFSVYPKEEVFNQKIAKSNTCVTKTDQYGPHIEIIGKIGTFRGISSGGKDAGMARAANDRITG